MSKSTDKDIEKYVLDLMPKRVKKALGDAKYDLYNGPSGGGMGYVKASKIVEQWWSDNMGDDLVVDDGGNVTPLREFEKFADAECGDRYKEALKEARANKLEDDEAESFARREAEYYRDSFSEVAVMYDSSHVKRLVLGRDWT